MAAAQPAYEYGTYDYSYDPNATAAATAAGYSSYQGYESAGSYPATATYEEYPGSGAYHTAVQSGASYAAVDPYSGYSAAGYSYPATAAPTGPSAAANASQAAYAAPYSSSPSTAGYAYDPSRANGPPPPSAAAPPTASHYQGYEYPPGAAGAYPVPPSAANTAYSPYKTAPAANGAPSNVYSSYPSAGPPAHTAYGVAPPSHLGGAAVGPPGASHMYGAPPAGGPMIPRRPEYYPPSSVSHPMHYVHHQPSSMSYRLPPRGGYQRELDEPGDENALLRHVVYITGLPKEIQNETLAEVFGAACGPIAPVDVRSPKPKIWVYKDRQTREGKGEATITFINPESAQMAISYFNGKELFGREIRVTLCPRRMYNMQKQNTPFNPGAAPVNTTTPISAMIKPTNNNANINTNGAIPTSSASSTTSNTATTTTTTTAPSTTSTSTAATTTTTTSSSSSNTVSAANPIATISSSTLGLPRQLNHSLFKIRQTPEQQRGLLPTPPIPFGGPMMGSTLQRDGVRKELPRIALTRGNYANPAGVRPKPY